MLGRHHLLLSLFSIAPLLVPYFKDNIQLILVISIGVAIGSLMPDADSPDAAIFHEKLDVKGTLGKIINRLFAPLFPIFGYTTKYAIYKPAVFIFGNTFLKKYNIIEQHRGFLHSFIGVSTATIMTAIYLLIVLLLFKLFNITYFISFLLAYVFVAFMHLLEDSTTVTGVQFNYPFSNLILKGELITKPEFATKPTIFTYFLIGVTGTLFLGMELKYITYPNWIITIITSIFLVICWGVFLFLIAKIKIERGELKNRLNVKSLF
jgi:membrane-bound metal-dependent hydrolase YbcI (DUF457 family)